MSLPGFLAPYRDELEALKRDYIHIELQEVAPDNDWYDYNIEQSVLDVRVSKFLGKPYWPKSTAYPRRSSDDRPMILVAQINFSETPPLGDFPRSGLLQLFVCAGKGDYVRWSENYCIVFHENIDEDALQDFSFLTPDLFSESPVAVETALSFSKRSEYSGRNDVNFTFSGVEHSDGCFSERYTDFLNEFPQNQRAWIDSELQFEGDLNDKLGGYADFTQLDPRDKDGDVLVLQIIGTRDAFHSGTGHVFMPPQALRERDFSKAYLHHDNT